MAEIYSVINTIEYQREDGISLLFYRLATVVPQLKRH